MTSSSRRKKITSLEPIPSVEAAQQAARQIRQAIISGKYAPGQRLIERELTEQLDISRHPVREALRLLAREGFVELHRNRGAQVSVVDASIVREVYTIRWSLGDLALNKLIGNGNVVAARDIRHLATLVDKVTKLALSGRHDEAIDADLEFQQAMVDASGLQRVMKYFRELTDDVRRFDKSLGIVYADQESYVERYITPLFQMIELGRLEDASKVWKEKIDEAVDRFLSAIAAADAGSEKKTNEA
ncbi:GntR family transcriptional regulator [Paraburkholderia sp.]|uniref:GntR family transcriptional regulator n=1 Tax=Paraburkholderia sp. TaxID=1926495 RepID=UPI003C797D01